MPDPHFPKLNDSNYADWHYMLAATLVEKDLWDVVDSSLTRPAGLPNAKNVRAFVKKQQLACAKIILSIEASQLLHTCHNNPKEIWDSLQKVHWAHGFATCLSLRHRFLYMRKCDDQPIISWVSDVKKVAFQLEAAGVATIDEDIILDPTRPDATPRDPRRFYHVRPPPGPLCMRHAPLHEPPRLSHAVPTPH